jgi:hypothetical protein
LSIEIRVHGEKAEVWRLKTSPENDGEASRRFEGVWSCVWIWNPYLSEKRVGDDGVDEKSFDGECVCLLLDNLGNESQFFKSFQARLTVG